MSISNTAKKFTPKKPDNLIEGIELVDTSEGMSMETNTLDESSQAGTSAEQDSSSDVSTAPDVIIKDVDSAPPIKNVKVRTSCDHRCCIGGEWYDFKKGVQKTVPEEVKATLLKAGLLMPL